MKPDENARRHADAAMNAMPAARAAPARRLALTPAGALWGYSRATPDRAQRCLQDILSGTRLPVASDWVEQSPEHAAVYALGKDRGWLQEIARDLHAPDVRLDDFLPHIIAGLSGERRAALASSGGFCVGHAGYALAEAEALCVAAADYSEFARRQRLRGWKGAGGMTSFHDDAAMLIPTVSFVPFWIDGVDYCLVLGGEPLINHPALVELIWGIQSAGARFSGAVGGARRG